MKVKLELEIEEVANIIGAMLHVSLEASQANNYGTSSEGMMIIRKITEQLIEQAPKPQIDHGPKTQI